MVVGWMCGASLGGRASGVELDNRLGVEGVTDIERQGQLRRGQRDLGMWSVGATMIGCQAAGTLRWWV